MTTVYIIVVISISLACFNTGYLVGVFRENSRITQEQEILTEQLSQIADRKQKFMDTVKRF